MATHTAEPKRGRPGIGAPVNLRLPPVLMQAVEAERRRLQRQRFDGVQVTLNDAIRDVLGRALLAPKGKR